MKGIVIAEVVSKAGEPVITLASNPLTIYQRRNGSFYVMDERKRKTVTQRPDGSFHLLVVSS